MIISALFVSPKGPYAIMSDVICWDESKDARKYNGPHRVIAHPPCQRWGRYWSGGPSAKVKRLMGDDGGCFKSALLSVQKFGGVLEHPEASHAFKAFNLPLPAFHGGWTKEDEFGGRSCCVAQGHYGHRAQKMTWLYAILNEYPELKWGRCKDKTKMDLGFHSKEERARAIKTGVCQRLSKKQRIITPIEFAVLLKGMVKS